jgi:tetratricopeptide (TPR) repeat protein
MNKPIERWLCVGCCLLVLLVGLGTPAVAQAKKPAAPKAASSKGSPLTQAQELLARGDLQGAENGAWKVLAANPENQDALTLLGIIRGQQQRYAEAEVLFAKVVKLAPGSVPARLNLANALLIQGKVDEAIQQCKDAAARAPKDPAVKVALARIYVGKGQFQDALTSLEGVPAASLPPSALPLKAASLIGMDRKSEAEALAAKVGTSVPLALEMAEVYLRGGLSDAALRTLKGIAAARNLPARFYYLQGQVLLNKNEGVAAESSLQRALKLDPKSVETLVALAEISAMKQQHDQSLKFLTQAHDLAPDAVPVLRHMVIEAEASGQSLTALQAARELARESPDNLDDLYLASAAMLQGHDTVNALSVLRSYTAQRADDPNGWLALGMACLTQKNYPEAQTALERSAQLAPNRAETEYQLGVLDSEVSKQDEAITHFEKVLQIQPKHAQALAKLGGLYLQSGELEKAREALTRSLAADPNVPDTEYKLAMTLSKMGKTDEAREHMQRFQKLKQTLEAQAKGDTSR